MKKLMAAIVLCLLVTGVSRGQESNQNNPNATLIKEFARSAQADGITMSFVLLNDRTVDLLFEAPGKYAMRARARMTTTFFVQGTAEKDISLDTKFVVEQDGQTLNGESFSIKNFTSGTQAKGTKIDGIIQIEKKVDLTHPFKLKGKNVLVDFKLSPEALKLNEPLPPPAAPASKPN